MKRMINQFIVIANIALRIPDDSRKYDSHNCANHLSNCANDLTLKLVSSCPLEPNLNTIYKIWLQVRATPNLVSNQIV